MNFKKGLLAFCLVMCILFCISSVSAGDLNATTTASDDINDISDNEEILSLDKKIEENANDELSDDTLAIEKNDKDTEIDNTVATIENGDDEILSYDKTINFEIKVYKQTGSYPNDKKVYFKVSNAETGAGEGYAVVQCDIYKNDGGYIMKTVETNGNGIGVLDFSKINANIGAGTYNVWFSLLNSEDFEIYYDADIECNSEMATVKILGKQGVTIKPTKLITTYKSGKYFQAKVINSKNKKAVKGVAITMKVYTGKKAKTVTLKSNAKGIVKYSSSKLGVGTHKVILKVKKSNYFTGKSATSYIKVKKQKVIINPLKLSTTYKSGAYFKAFVKNTKTKKGVKGIAVILRVAGKTVTLKTNAYGIVKYSTSKLGVGTHKVVLKVKSKNYAGKAKVSYIIIAQKKSSSKSGSSSNTNTNTNSGKLRTTLTINECYRGNGAIAGYYIKATLKDSRGHPVANKKINIRTVLYVAGEADSSLSHYATTNSKGVADGYVNTLIGGDIGYDVTIRFAGDKSYYASSAHRYLP